MRYHHVLPLVALATAATVPDRSGSQQALLRDSSGRHHDSLWESLPGRNTDRGSSFEDMLDTVGQSIDKVVEAIARTGRRVVGSLTDERRHGRGDGYHSRDTNETLYDLIQNSRYSRRFAKMISEYDDLRERLRDERREYTVFVPTDEAFERIPENEKPSREFLEKILDYHVVPGEYSSGRIMAAHTLPTVLEERDLGHHHQRVRVSVGLFGIHLNFYSQLVASNIVSRRNQGQTIHRPFQD
jgi:uncharacterized surface protein with fasciclin (FAS1) repeats